MRLCRIKLYKLLPHSSDSLGGGVMGGGDETDSRAHEWTDDDEWMMD